MMPEAEVSLRLAFWLLDQCGPDSHADVAIDGAHVRISSHIAAGKRVEDRVIFPIQDFLRDAGWHQELPSGDWRGQYSRRNQTFTIRSIQGFDVRIVGSGRSIKAECKGGPLEIVKGHGANAILAQAIGQIITSSTISPGDELWVAVPDTPSFQIVGSRIAASRAFANTGIRIALVSMTGDVRLIN